MACQGEPNARIMAFEFPVNVFRRQSAEDRVYPAYYLLLRALASSFFPARLMIMRPCEYVKPMHLTAF